MVPVELGGDALGGVVGVLQRVGLAELHDRVLRASHPAQVVGPHVVGVGHARGEPRVDLAVGQRVVDAAEHLVGVDEVVVGGEVVGAHRERLLVEGYARTRRRAGRGPRPSPPRRCRGAATARRRPCRRRGPRRAPSCRPRASRRSPRSSSASSCTRRSARRRRSRGRRGGGERFGLLESRTARPPCPRGRCRPATGRGGPWRASGRGAAPGGRTRAASIHT